MPESPLIADVTTRLLVLDAEPWYEAPPGYDDAVRRLLACYPTVITAPRLAELTATLAGAVLAPGDVVVTPLMSGGLLLPSLRETCARLELPLLLVPMSKHPFVTLSADTGDELMATCRLYARSSAGLPRLPQLLRRLLHRDHGRLVFIDSSTAVGTDALLLRERCADWLGYRPTFCFAALINEIGADEATAPGWRHGPKVLRPDACALRLRHANTKYLSHLRFLCLDWDAQVAVARAVRGALPQLTAYWETVPPALRHIHGHRNQAVPIYRERLHVRFAADEDDRMRSAAAAAVAELDAKLPLRVTAARQALRAQLIGGWLTAGSPQAGAGRASPWR